MARAILGYDVVVAGDGMADLVGFKSYGVWVALSTGRSFAPATLWSTTYSAGSGGWSSYDLYPRTLGDVDSSGRAAIVGFGGRKTYVTRYDHQARFYYDADGNRVVSINDGARNFYVGDWIEAETAYYHLGGQRVAKRTTGGVTYLHGDHLGSTSKTTGAASSAQLYDAYGAKRGASEVDTPYRYTGHRWEENDALDIYYYKARWYDPQLGRFLQPDSIVPDCGEVDPRVNALTVNLGEFAQDVREAQASRREQSLKEAGSSTRNLGSVADTVFCEPLNPQALNRYVYGYDNPLINTDPDGHIAFLVPVVTGLIGGVAGGAGAIIAQMVSAEESSFADRWGQVDWGDVAIAAGVGAVAGAAAPFIAVSALGAAALGAGANVAQYSLTQWSNDEAIEGTTLLANAVVGGLTGGVIQGATPLVDTSTTLMFDATSPWLDQALARSINTSLELAPIISTENMVRSSVGGVVSNWPWADEIGW